MLDAFAMPWRRNKATSRMAEYMARFTSTTVLPSSCVSIETKPSETSSMPRHGSSARVCRSTVMMTELLLVWLVIKGFSRSQQRFTT